MKLTPAQRKHLQTLNEGELSAASFSGHAKRSLEGMLEKNLVRFLRRKGMWRITSKGIKAIKDN